MPRHPWNDPRPFAVGPESSRIGFLLVHGFTGAPTEVRPVADHLAARGHRCIGVQLTGHGTHVENLRDVSRAHWKQVVAEGHRWLAEDCERVVLVGLSMGGLLSVIEAANHGCDGLVLIAPAFEIANPLFALLPWLGWMPGAIAAPSGSGLVSREGWKQLWHYERRPFRAARELHRLQVEARAALVRVTAPVLLVQGMLDQTLEPMGAQRAFDRLRASHRQLVWLHRSGHIATVDVEADVLFGAIDGFIAEIGAA